MPALNFSFSRKRMALYAVAGFAFAFIWWFTDFASQKANIQERALNHLWRVIFITVSCFFLFEYTLARFRRKRILISFLLLLGHAFLFSWGVYAWRYLGILLHVYTPLTTFPSVGHAVSEQMQFSIMSVLFFGISRHIYDHIKLKSAAQQLRIEKQEAELNYLKSQTNPHFLFNTLNNIYSLARDKSDLAPESILRLSQMLRFMLYETGGAYIEIEQELKIITDYIALEGLRYDDSLSVSFTQEIEDPKQPLPPLLLIPLVENAFKHGVSETRSQPFVAIHLSVQGRQLAFTVENSSEPSGERSVKESIGLPNLRRQLELLYTDFSLSVHQGGSVFSATLQINLASHV